MIASHIGDRWIEPHAPPRTRKPVEVKPVPPALPASLPTEYSTWQPLEIEGGNPLLTGGPNSCSPPIITGVMKPRVIDEASAGYNCLEDIAHMRMTAVLISSEVHLLHIKLKELAVSRPALKSLCSKVEIVAEIVKGCVVGAAQMPIVKLPGSAKQRLGLTFKEMVQRLCAQLEETSCGGTANVLLQLLTDIGQMPDGLATLDQLLTGETRSA